MQDRIQVLNVAVDIASTKVASDATIGYMKEVGSKVVYFLNSETLLLLEGNSDLRAIVEDCEMVLPGTASVNASINEVLGHKRDSFFLESYFDVILDYAVEMGHEILIVAENQERFVSIQENIQGERPYITLSGVFLTKQEESLEHIVNEINSVAPEVVLIALEERKQLELLQQHRNQINAELMIFTGTIFYNKAVSEAEVPEQIQKLRIGHLYKWYRKDGRMRAFFSNMIMKLKLNKHKNKQEP